MDLRRAAAFALLAACGAAPVAAEDDCQMLPPEVRERAVYAGFSASRMCGAGLRPLWQGVPDGAAQVMRFTFSSGHALFWRSVTITRNAGGTGVLEVVGGGHRRRDVRSPWVNIRKVRRRLSAGELANVTTLASRSGTFDHAVGTWDRSVNAEGEIFLHCQTLKLERADAVGYRFSSANIGCNRPAALMPLVDEVIRLAKIDMVRGNWAGYP